MSHNKVFLVLQSWGWQCDQISCNSHWRKPGQELSPHCASVCWMVQLNNTNPLRFKLQSSWYISYEYRPRCQLCSVHICSHFISKRHASICSSVHMGSKCQHAASLSPSKKHKWDSANFDTRKRSTGEDYSTAKVGQGCSTHRSEVKLGINCSNKKLPWCCLLWEDYRWSQSHLEKVRSQQC